MSIMIPRGSATVERRIPPASFGGNAHGAVSRTFPSTGTSMAVLSYEAEVDLHGRGLVEFPNPGSLPNCTSLDLSGNLIERFSTEYRSSKVRRLDVSHNRIATALNVAAFRFLEILDLSGNTIDSAEPLRNLVHINHLNVSRNELTSLDALSGLTQLRELRAAENRVQRIPDLSRCTALVALDLHQNSISNPENIHKLLPPQIQHLDLSENNVDKLCHLTTLAALKQLKTLRLAGNPCWGAALAARANPRPFTVFLVPSLQRLDTNPVTNAERQAAAMLFTNDGGSSGQLADELLPLLQAQFHAKLLIYLSQQCPLKAGPTARGSSQVSNPATRALRVQESPLGQGFMAVAPSSGEKTRLSRLHASQAEGPPLAPSQAGVHPVGSNPPFGQTGNVMKTPRQTGRSLAQSGPAAAASTDNLSHPNAADQGEVRRLQRQVAEMRKYFKLWVHRERSARETAALRIQAFVRGENVRRRFRLKLPSVCADSRKSHSTSSSAMAAAATANAAQEAAAAAVALTTRQALEIADLTRQVGVAHGALRTLWAEMARMHEDMRRMKNATETATAAATAAAEAARSAATSAAAAAAAAAEAKRAPIAGAADTAMDSAKGPESPSPRDADIESASPTKFDKASSPPNNKEDKPLSPSPGVSLSPGAQRAEVLRSHLDPSEVAESGQYFSGANHGQPRRPGGGTFHGVSAISEATRRGPRMHEPHHQRFQHHLPQQQRQLQHDTEDKNVLEPQQAQSDENNSRAAVHPPSQSKAPSNQHFQPSLSQRPSPPTRQQQPVRPRRQQAHAAQTLDKPFAVGNDMRNADPEPTSTQHDVAKTCTGPSPDLETVSKSRKANDARLTILEISSSTVGHTSTTMQDDGMPSSEASEVARQVFGSDSGSSVGSQSSVGVDMQGMDDLVDDIASAVLEAGTVRESEPSGALATTLAASRPRAETDADSTTVSDESSVEGTDDEVKSQARHSVGPEGKQTLLTVSEQNAPRFSESEVLARIRAADEVACVAPISGTESQVVKSDPADSSLADSAVATTVRENDQDDGTEESGSLLGLDAVIDSTTGHIGGGSTEDGDDGDGTEESGLPLGLRADINSTTGHIGGGSTEVGDDDDGTEESGLPLGLEADIDSTTGHIGGGSTEDGDDDDDGTEESRLPLGLEADIDSTTGHIGGGSTVDDDDDDGTEESGLPLGLEADIDSTTGHIGDGSTEGGDDDGTEESGLPLGLEADIDLTTGYIGGGSTEDGDDDGTEESGAPLELERETDSGGHDFNGIDVDETALLVEEALRMSQELHDQLSRNAAVEEREEDGEFETF